MVKHFFSIFALGMASTPFLSLHGATSATPSAFPTQDNVRFVGAVTCQSSMCHGGASPSRDQFTIWSHQDFHSRAYATLVTPRSVRIAEGLGIALATESNRCTTCHAPFAALPAGHLATTANATEGVSCESCHNGAEAWLRGHTRPDWTYADRVHAGLRDLKSAYVRANTCVACHQVLDPELLKAGHPALVFELDGQSASEPRHWKEKDAWFGPKAWLVGQAVALREISKAQVKNPDQNLAAEQRAITWLLQQAQILKIEPNAPEPDSTALSAYSNEIAQGFSKDEWTTSMTLAVLRSLTSTTTDFNDSSVPLAERELRAERLVLGLDRLYKSLYKDPDAPGQAELAALFGSVQDRASFNPGNFASLLQKFADAIAVKK